jgi:hypothetical protein
MSIDAEDMERWLRDKKKSAKLETHEQQFLSDMAR